MDAISQNLQTIVQAIRQQSNAVTLIAVSKTQPIAAIESAIAAGQRDFGENYVQEGVDKIRVLYVRRVMPPLVWHMIGPIQSNKTALVAAHFDWVHTIDRASIATRLSNQRPQGLHPLQVCVQVNIDDEATKSGVAPAEVPALCAAIRALPRLQLRGLMCIPANTAGSDAISGGFVRMKTLFDDLNAAGMGLDVLSMGMSGDYPAAIAVGATHLRVGSAIFGERTKRG